MKSNKVITLLICLLILTACGKENLTCKKGELVDGVCKSVELADATVTCPSGYTFNKETSKCTNTMKIAAKTVNKCAAGYVIGNEKWCVSETQYDLIETRECISSRIQEGDTLSSTYIAPSNYCYEKICIEKNADGTECLKYEENKINYTKTKACPSGMRKWDGFCRKISWMKVETSCEVGVLEKDMCIIENNIDPSISCKDGYKLIDGNKCQKVIYEEAVKK